MYAGVDSIIRRNELQAAILLVFAVLNIIMFVVGLAKLEEEENVKERTKEGSDS